MKNSTAKFAKKNKSGLKREKKSADFADYTDLGKINQRKTTGKSACPTKCKLEEKAKTPRGHRQECLCHKRQRLGSKDGRMKLACLRQGGSVKDSLQNAKCKFQNANWKKKQGPCGAHL